MPRPAETPIGLELANAARVVGRAFDDRLAAAGGSRPTWLVLLALKQGRTRNQRELAAAIGIQGATLTHHLNAMENDGLVVRRRDPDNRRVHILEMTEAGEAAFLRLAVVAGQHDARLRAGFSPDDLAQLRDLLARLRANVESGADAVALPAAAEV
ncbi:MarR family winged helix-turn-helix transcriptional regulator [Pseudonocardia sp. CA-107938]|uniref:MarR family winged helix-turn-helix transcriptional regulator n=1 Tax=Pseudonocardia sp. CA-107938 TaxID=3240021 RepID=UPI003D8ACFB8